MVPERKIIDRQIVATQQTRSDTASQRFGQAYSNRQNMFSVGADFIRRIAGRQTTGSEIDQSIAAAQEERLNLAEVRARQAAQGALNDTIYRQELATHFAEEYFRVGNEIAVTTQAETQTPGLINNLYRGYTTAAGATLRLLAGMGILWASREIIQNPNYAAGMADIGILIAASGVMDTTRHLFLQAFNRNRNGAGFLNVTQLIRRRASVQEGQITGDELDGPGVLENVLQTRLTQEVRDQLEIDGITRPDLRNFTNFKDILRQRVSLRDRIPRYEDLKELVRARDIARVSRLTRTLLLTVLAVGLLNHYVQRPEFCGYGAYTSSDPEVERMTGGITGLSSAKGDAERIWFKRLTGKDFDMNNPKDREIFDSTFNLDPEGNTKIIQQIVSDMKNKPGREFVTPDLFKHGRFWLVCNAELDGIYNRP